jgi:predicted homoserine dehydrogenase-like protein
VLFNDAVIAPLAGPVCDVITAAKKDLKKGDVIDCFGGFCAYGLLENADVSLGENLLPMGLSQGCILKHPIKKDQVIKYSDVELPEGRLCDKLWGEQNSFFGK